MSTSSWLVAPSSSVAESLRTSPVVELTEGATKLVLGELASTSAMDGPLSWVHVVDTRAPSLSEALPERETVLSEPTT